MTEVIDKAKAARRAATDISTMDIEQRNGALKAMADAIWRNRVSLVEANRKDLAEAKVLINKGEIRQAVVQRLKLDLNKVQSVVDMVRSVADLEDPVGRTLYAKELDEGLELYRVSSPLGVVGVVFESRPDALPQIASLCLKSGNAVLMKGGSETKHSNQALFSVIKEATEEAGAPEDWIQLLEAREEVVKLLSLHEYVDLIVPRGSNNFVRYIQSNTKIPVLGHSDGVCQIYVDSYADQGKAVEVCLDAKVQYPSVCNAVDAILVHKDIYATFLPKLVQRLVGAGVEVRGCPVTVELLGDEVKQATDHDWGHEYLDYIVAVRVVDSLDEAIEYVNTFGSHHTDAIITEDRAAAIRFLGKVDSANVFWNASTRFSDGYRYGLGAEVGISTAKIHARGPTGLEGLTIYKYLLLGRGQTVGPYAGKNRKSFTHRKIDGKWVRRAHEW
jgi:glutamate-5-semialdehyde dehydrogenase